MGTVPRIVLLLLVNALPPASVTTRAQPQRVAEELGLSGYVLAPDGTPVSGGNVVFQSSAVPASTSIDGRGRFRFAADRAGGYQIVVSVPGFAPYRFRVTVPASRTLRLPVIHLAPATYFRVRFVSAAGDPIAPSPLRRRSFDGRGMPVLNAPDGGSDQIDSDGAARIGPLPRGITALALDSPFFAQTRVPNFTVTGADALLDGGTVVVQPGSVLHVDLLDASGAPVADHLVSLEDVLPLSPLQFPWPVRTNAEGRATFERLAAGRYRVRTLALGRCVTQELSVARTVTVSGTGTVGTRIVIAGKATFRISSPVGSVKGIVVSATPDTPVQASPVLLVGRGAPSQLARSLNVTNCRGTTDADGRATLSSFPPGPSDIAVHFSNSLYVRRLEVPIGGGEVAVAIPDGLLPVRVINAVKNEPVARAFVTWTIEGGGRAEATTTITGDALLEGVGTKAGTLTITAPGFQTAEEQLPEPPGVLHDVALVPEPAATLQARLVLASGEPLPNAVVEVSPENPLEAPRIAVTDERGVVSFSDVPRGAVRLTASADGFVVSTIRIPEERRDGVVLTLSRGYRVIASVEWPAEAGPHLIRVVNEAGARVDDSLDSASDRSLEPPGRMSLGPLAPGTYVIELHGAREHRQERIRVVDRDVYATFR